MGPQTYASWTHANAAERSWTHARRCQTQNSLGPNRRYQAKRPLPHHSDRFVMASGRITSQSLHARGWPTQVELNFLVDGWAVGRWSRHEASFPMFDIRKLVRLPALPICALYSCCILGFSGYSGSWAPGGPPFELCSVLSLLLIVREVDTYWILRSSSLYDDWWCMIEMKNIMVPGSLAAIS